MMSNSILDSIDIENFRAFQHLHVDRFKRIDLIVGKNNIGKSTLLEAIWLYANRGAPTVIWQLLESRNEGNRPAGPVRATPGSDNEDSSDALSTVKSLFYGRNSIKNKSTTLHIGPVGSDTKQMALWIELFEDAQKTLFDDASRVDYAFHVAYGRAHQGVYPIDRYSGRKIEQRLDVPAIPCTFIPTNGMAVWQVEKWWDDIALTPSEADVLAALKIIAPEVERLSMVARQSGRTYPIAKVAGMQEPVPLRSLGEGMNRLLWIALALAHSRDGILLIDEIDIGLHYSVQPQVWQLVFETALRLNVQVFATTHSLDCIRAFQQVSRSHSEEGMLVSLRARKDNPNDIVSIQYDEDKLEIATQEQIEVR
jgi:hypothetical protein